MRIINKTLILKLTAFIAAMLFSLLFCFSGWASQDAILVTEFGALPNDGKDDTAGVLAALEKRSKINYTLSIVFPQGRYDFFAGSNPKDKNTLITASSIDNLTLEGCNVELIFHGLTGGFAFSNCKNLTLAGFSIDWDRPLFSTGTVIASEDNHFDIEIQPEYPVKGGEPVQAYMEYDPETKLPMRKGLDEYNTVDKTELLREQVLRVYTKNQAPVKPGMLIVLRHQVYGYNAISCSRCSDVMITGVTVYHTPGMGFVGSVCTNVTLDKFCVLPKPGRIMSTTADATHFSGCKGTIKMNSCEYEGMGDDGVNIKSGLYLSLNQIIDDRTIIGSHNLGMIDAPDPGDEMEICHTDDLIPYAKAKVRNVVVLNEQKSIKLEFESPLPAELKEGDVFGNATRTPKVRITNTQVRNNRARGMLIQTRDAIIDNCKFIRCSGPGIMVFTEVQHFFESIGTRDVSVRNCLFDHCNYGAAMGPGVLCAFAQLKDRKNPPKPGVHRDVTFEGNRIDGTDYSGIFAAGVDGLTISKNTIESTCQRIGGYGINITSSSRINISNNTAHKARQGENCRDILKLSDNIDRSAVKMVDNKGF